MLIRMLSKRDYVVYVAGPYRGSGKGVVTGNVMEAAITAGRIRTLGFTALVPHLESVFNEGSISENEWLDHGLTLLRRSDVIFDFRKGRVSKGTEKEIELAIDLGKPVVVTEAELLAEYERFKGETILEIGSMGE